MANRPQPLAQMPLRSYSRTEFTALRARVKGLPIETIERLYFDRDAVEQVWPMVINTAMTITDTELGVVRVDAVHIRVGHATVSKNENGTRTLECVREMYEVADHTVTFGLGPIGHTMRTVLKEDKVDVTKA